MTPKQLETWAMVRAALDCALDESIVIGAERVLRTGKGRVDVASAILPSLPRLEWWERMAMAAERTRAHGIVWPWTLSESVDSNGRGRGIAAEQRKRGEGNDSNFH